MKKILLILCLIINTYKCELKKYNHTNNESNLYFVLTIFRHGARYPLNVKKDCFQNEITYPGQLTLYGTLQHLVIGRNYRKRYYNFLKLNNQTFNKEQIMIISSTIGRTVLSAKKQIEGLYNISLNNSNIRFVNIIKNVMNLYCLNQSEIQKMQKIIKSCTLRELEEKKNEKKNFRKYFQDTIIPVFKQCYGNLNYLKKKIFVIIQFLLFLIIHIIIIQITKSVNVVIKRPSFFMIIVLKYMILKGVGMIGWHIFLLYFLKLYLSIWKMQLQVLVN